MIRISGYRNDFVATKIGLSLASFTSKLKNDNFSVREVLKIISIVKSEKVEDFLLLEIMKSRKDEATISLQQLEKEMGWLSL
ncbi:hypothetical protein ACFP1I_09900 [Dyadobacter subterraneus]|uniref:XRE family transcriptional regulator n=1 Tax=Dyadobacter subterraneus TaxID=2773304 RepID=A0ABR9WAS6_9BACT|nr:hypothetical protein [Dyadobacter subterraneus]MBE9462584.1 hypothetical protein [Dyadobacter subterraneus]